MATLLNSEEKTILRYWLSDGAPGYINMQSATNQRSIISPLKQSDYVAIDAIDNDILRGYLTTYQTQKISEITQQINQYQSAISMTQSKVSNLQNISTAISSISVQSVPTSQ